MMSDDKTIIFLTTTTSATVSITRIVNTIIEGRLKFISSWNAGLGPSAAEQKAYVPPSRGHFVMHNVPTRFNRELDLGDYRIIVNFRDPRDKLCNGYHWQFSHPKPNETEEETKARIAGVEEMGIDSYVLREARKRGAKSAYDTLFWVLENAPQGHAVAATYAQLCCNFDGFVKRIEDFTGYDPSADARKLLEAERPEAIEENPKWIGAKWSGSDTAPGRYRRELRPETIAELNEIFDHVLQKMATFDPEFAHQYLAAETSV